MQISCAEYATGIRLANVISAGVGGSSLSGCERFGEAESRQTKKLQTEDVSQQNIVQRAKKRPLADKIERERDLAQEIK